jgi:hypothetical protein
MTVPMQRILGLLALAALLAGGCQLFPGLGTGSPPVTTPGEENVSGKVVAGPTCPVESSPPDPRCAPRQVASATLLIQDLAGHTVATVVSDGTGAFSLTLPPGDYVLVAQPVDGLMGTAPPLSFSVVAASPVELTVEYDTGIR